MARRRPTAKRASQQGNPLMAKHDLEMALEVNGDGTDRPFGERIRRAARVAGGDLVCVVPAPGAKGEFIDHALVLLPQSDGAAMIAVRNGPDGLVFDEEKDIDEVVLDFARTSLDVLARLCADESVRTQTRAAAEAAPA